jgi:arylsulfatase A-like enzyme
MTPRIGTLIFLFGLAGAAHADTPRPNILWLTSEDHGPHLGCYGDKYATTPNVDGLAARGMIYTHAWSNAPVCAPARTCIISGLYPPSTGGEHMRSLVAFPAGKKMFPQYLREAGYYCSNNSKEDYNLAKPGKVWDDSSAKAHWRKRKKGQPFFAVFNSLKSHESQIRRRPHKAVHDPAKVRLPAYHPDTPEVRQDWAQYYDVVSEADADAGQRLKELQEDGLAEDTIVFYYADHGSGMPRSKRWPYNSGLHVPMIVHIPEKFRKLAAKDYKPGGKSDRLVSFVDLAPTVLSLAGIEPPKWMQGRAFLGAFIAEAPAFNFGFRSRMDERDDLVRSATDGRYVYVRNYLPHLIYGQHIAYMFETPTTRIWKKRHDEGELNAVQDRFWRPKPPEELYDLQTDPDEVHNLADSAEHQAVKKKLRAAQQEWARTIRDVGFLPEGERFTRAPGVSPYDMGHDEAKYPFDRVFAAAEQASELKPKAVPALVKGLQDEDSAVRYWSALGLGMRGKKTIEAHAAELRKAMEDRSPHVRIVAAEALAAEGSEADTKQSLPVLVTLADWDKNDVFVTMAALRALDGLGANAAGGADAIRKLPAEGKVPDARYRPYVPALLKHLNDH